MTDNNMEDHDKIMEDIHRIDNLMKVLADMLARDGNFRGLLIESLSNDTRFYKLVKKIKKWWR